jgi:hypothetical protein
VVVARANPIKERCVDVDTQGLPGALFDFDSHGEATTVDLKLQVRFVDQTLPLDYVARILTIERHNRVANGQTCLMGRRTFFKFNHNRRTHNQTVYE